MNTKQLENTLIELIRSMAVSGYEWDLDIANTIQRIIGFKGERIGDNLIYRFGSGERTIFLSAHMDEVGFFITQVEKTSCKIIPIGSVDIEDLIGCRLLFEINGQRQLTDVIKTATSFSELKVTGLTDPLVGAVGTFEKKYTLQSPIIESPSLDNKVGCLTLITLIQKLVTSRLDKNVIICFASREEVSTNGLMSAVRVINPDICIDIDSAYAQPIFNLKKRKNWSVPVIGKGPALQLMGEGFILRSSDRNIVESTSQRLKIPLQYEIPDCYSGGTNASTLILNGYETIQINIPVANQHSANSKAHIEDISKTSTLLLELLTVIKF